MITFSALGNYGRLGNQIFQYASLFSVGFLRGIEVGIPTDQKISDVFELQSAKDIPKDFEPKFIASESSFAFDPNLFLIPDGVDIRGYFQSGHYFRHCQEALRKELKFHPGIRGKAQDFLKSRSQIPLCSLHVRRGDYTNLSHYHKNLGTDYYQQACNIVKSNVPNAKFLVFSDDPEWCKQIFTDTSNFEVVEIGDDAVELCVMSNCPIHIIANSSFSWWGAWLSNSQAVIAPKEWFAEQGPKDWSTLYEPHWIMI